MNDWLFPPPDGKELKNKGIQQVSDNNETWMERCVESAVRFLRLHASHKFITGEDIRFHCMGDIGFPKHHNAWGALINTLIKRKLIRPTGEHRSMSDPRSHARSTPLYEKV